MEPSTNSSLYVATASFSARRGPRADTVAQEIAGLKTRIYALENPTVAAVSNVTKTGNDPEQCVSKSNVIKKMVVNFVTCRP